VLFAKREAIERAGVRVKSVSTVKDLMIESDYIETKAEAVLLPGYKIMDIGYSEDGYYTIVLSGKVKPTKNIIRKEKIILYIKLNYNPNFNCRKKGAVDLNFYIDGAHVGRYDFRHCNSIQNELVLKKEVSKGYHSVKIDGRCPYWRSNGDSEKGYPIEPGEASKVFYSSTQLFVNVSGSSTVMTTRPRANIDSMEFDN